MILLVGKTACRQLLKIPSKIRVKIENKIEKLPADPFLAGCQKLSGREGSRLRMGDYRVLYTLDKKQKSYYCFKRPTSKRRLQKKLPKRPNTDS